MPLGRVLKTLNGCLLKNHFDFKIASEKLNVVDIIIGIENALKYMNSVSMANAFRYECMSIIKKGRDKKENNITEKICRKKKICSGVRRWLKQKNNLLLMENDKGRATCIIAKEKRDELVTNEMHNVERYSKLKKDDIDKVRTAVNKRLKEMVRDKILTIEEEKELRQKTRVTPSARPTLKSHKDPLKVRLIINT